jgi:hypothetical protein
MHARYTYMHAYIHTYIYTYIHNTYIHNTYIHTYTHIHTHTNINTATELIKRKKSTELNVCTFFNSKSLDNLLIC